MIEIIKDELFEMVENKVATIDFPQDATDYNLKNSYRNFVLIREYPEEFSSVTPINLYYNLYYFFLVYSSIKQKLYGYDAGLEQQEYKILEQGEQYSNVDWSVIEEISNQLKNIKLRKKNRILIIIVAILMFLGFLTYSYYYISNLKIGIRAYRIPSRVNGHVVYLIADSLRKNSNWEYDPPKEWKTKIIYFDAPNVDENEWFYIKKTDSTENFMVNILTFDVMMIKYVFTDSLRFSHNNLNMYQDKKYGDIIINTLFREIEKEALKRGLSDSEIYLDKKTLEEFGYHDFAEKIYPTKKFLFWEYD